MLAWQRAGEHDSFIRASAPQPTPQQSSAIKAWNLMGGQVEWAALPFLVEIFGVRDIEQFIQDLSTIREAMRSES